MASFLELAGENRFRIRAYANAAQTLENLTEDVEILAHQNTLTDLPGIGQGIADKIKEFCATGRVKEHEQMKARFPEGLLDLMEVSGLGPKRTRFLFDRLKIDSLEKLKEAARKGALRDLEGFGPKIEENILKGIAAKDESSKRLLLSDARTLSQSILMDMTDRCRSIQRLVPAGSLRRWKETIGDLDFLCISQTHEEVIRTFTGLPGVKRVLAEGETKASVVLKSGVQCDLRVVEPGCFGAALLYFTGSKEHNVALRELALKKGLTINEYGLYRLGDKKKPVAGKTEEEIYAKLGMEFIPPELRENHGEIAAALAKKLPKLIEEKDVRGDLHNHTRLSDGANSLEEMAGRARDKGWEWFVSADHSQSLKVAHGLSRETLLAKKSEIKKLNRHYRNFRLLLGSEVDILSDGRMDYDDRTLDEIDIVVGSIHTGFSQGEEKITGRILAAMENRRVDIVGHMTGRLINSREPYAVNVPKILKGAAATQTALEINGQPQRLDMNDATAKTAGEIKVPIALSTDAHTVRQLDYMTLAVAQARRAWLTKNQVLNS